MSLKDIVKYNGDDYIIYTTESFDISSFRFITAICINTILDSSKILYECNNRQWAEKYHSDTLKLSPEQICNLYNNRGERY